MTKFVTFGAFVEILDGVEGLVHISELAQHHVENPREIVSQGESVRAKIIEMDAERRRLSLSLKRVEDGEDVRTPHDHAPLGLSEEVFAEGSAMEPRPEVALEEPQVEPLPELGDESIDADAVAPAEQGPGDSEGEAPAPPDEEDRG